MDAWQLENRLIFQGVDCSYLTIVEGGDVERGKNYAEAFRIVRTHKALESFCLVIGLSAYIGAEVREFGNSRYAINI